MKSVAELAVRSAAFPGTTWVEHFDWLEPLFNERLDPATDRSSSPTG